MGNALPTSIGGDVLRVVRLSAENDDRPSTFASVVLERMTGWIVLPVIALVGLSINPGLRHLGAATRVAVGFSLGTLVTSFLYLKVTAREGWTMSIVNSLCCFAFVYGLFEKGLGVPFPPGRVFVWFGYGS